MTTILLTRPTAESERFARTIRSRLSNDFEIVISPLLEIRPTPSEFELRSDHTAIFSSRNGVSNCRSEPASGQVAYCVGQRTTAAAREAGWAAIETGKDANELVAALQTEAPKNMLVHFRGRHSRGRIAQRLKAAGLSVQEQIVYDQILLPFSDEAIDVLNREKPVIVPLFSPRTAGQFQSCVPSDATVFVAAISKTVAAEVEQLPKYALEVANSPNAGEMLKAVERLLNRVERVEGA